MRNSIESKEELKILKKVENGEYKSVDSEEFAAMEAHLKRAASNTIAKLSKRKAISIRLLESDIERLKAMALNEGMPYQTYITHIIHKITTGRVWGSSHLILNSNYSTTRLVSKKIDLCFSNS